MKGLNMNKYKTFSEIYSEELLRILEGNLLSLLDINKKLSKCNNKLIEEKWELI